MIMILVLLLPLFLTDALRKADVEDVCGISLGASGVQATRALFGGIHDTYKPGAAVGKGV